MMELQLDAYRQTISEARTLTYGGTVRNMVGLLIESAGPRARMGEICKLVPVSREPVLGEVVGFRHGHVLLMPYGDLNGISRGTLVEATGKDLRVAVGENMLGRILDALGSPMDTLPHWPVETYYPAMEKPPGPLERGSIEKPVTTGIKAIDGLLTIGEGQRLGIFSGSGVGKSTLMGMIARNTSADVSVIGLIGERGREVKEFIERDLGEEGMKRSVVVAATSDEPPLLRIKAAWVATAVAEYFRDKGLSVLLMMDSITRWCMALREVGLAAGEPPTSRGYTPSVFASLPRLLERAGKVVSGSITGIYTVLVEGDDMDEPIADAARGILDGHIVLSRHLAEMGHYPAVDILGSVSRLMPHIVPRQQADLALKVRRVLSTYRKAEDLINIGAYVSGANSGIDEALKHIDKVNVFLRQTALDRVPMEKTVEELARIFEED